MIVLGDSDCQRLAKLDELILVELDQLRVGALLRWDLLVDVRLDLKAETRRLYRISVSNLPVPIDPKPRTIPLILLVIKPAVIILKIIRQLIQLQTKRLRLRLVILARMQRRVDENRGLRAVRMHVEKHFEVVSIG